MPYKFDTEKKIVGEKHDKRRKLTDEQRTEIKNLYGIISQRKLALKFGVSRRLIIFIGCPEKYIKNLKDRADRGGTSQYYHPDTQKVYMQKHRQHKKQLNQKGLLEQGGNKVCNHKQKCKLCREWFVNENGNRIYCYECSPKGISVKDGKKNE
jgi:hypothetical protein